MRRSSAWPILIWLLATLSVAAVALPSSAMLPERRWLDWERFWRKATVRFGYTLPGSPDYANFSARLTAQNMALGAPILIRIFKEEFELEMWLLRDGRFHHFATYPICRWSGVLGPKGKHGDHQAPEGFYAVDKRSLNPNSRWHRSFNLGFPNAFDRAHGRTGAFLMVHGGCSSIGCFAMTNAAIDEIWRLVTAALAGGQSRFQVQAFPFRMTDANMARHAAHPHADFWQQLKRGSDLFEQSFLPPKALVCASRYVFEAGVPGRHVALAVAPDCSTERQQAASAAKAQRR